jgi:phosphonate transport system ATP-binding protein
MKQLEVKNLIKSYDGSYKAVNEISLELNRGDFIILLGLSGSGKSTLLRCINRLIEPTGGDIIYDGQSIIGLKGQDLRAYRRKIAMVFQQFNLVKNLSVMTNVLTTPGISLCGIGI